ARPKISRKASMLSAPEKAAVLTRSIFISSSVIHLNSVCDHLTICRRQKQAGSSYLPRMNGMYEKPCLPRTLENRSMRSGRCQDALCANKSVLRDDRTAE